MIDLNLMTSEELEYYPHYLSGLKSKELDKLIKRKRFWDRIINWFKW